jgi:hypothetical protein
MIGLSLLAVFQGVNEVKLLNTDIGFFTSPPSPLSKGEGELNLKPLSFGEGLG